MADVGVNRFSHSQQNDSTQYVQNNCHNILFLQLVLKRLVPITNLYEQEVVQYEHQMTAKLQLSGVFPKVSFINCFANVLTQLPFQSHSGSVMYCT